ncbi:MAG TPA: hypothetical protein VLS93_19170 [Anaeromyxobacteraceae bacterium]|nr:hypothetical protein [Anaeromyxobacteraceae bacterium]
MTRTTITLLCLPIALAGAGEAVRATTQVRASERELAALAQEISAAGQSFLSTLQGEHARRQRAAFDRRREVALALASARRNRILGVLATAFAGLLASGLGALRRISAEIEADDRHLRAQGAYRRPDGS